MNIQRALKYAQPDNKIIGLLFSADYCKYCHVFVPKLRNVYPFIKEYGIEIIFVASDKSKEKFDEYLPQHPWPAIEYEDPIRVELRNMYNIKTIPALLFFDQNGNIIEINGRDLVVNMIENSYDDMQAAYSIANKFGLITIQYDSDASDF